jgi:hypothetical protein
MKPALTNHTPYTLSNIHDAKLLASTFLNDLHAATHFKQQN